jgi:hypothetical protein
MKAIDSRIRRLQERLRPDEGQPQGIWVAVIYGQQFALDRDRCVEILRDGGFLPATRFVVLHFFGIPDGLNAKELEEYLRRNGAQICGTGRDQQQSVPSGTSRPGYSTWSSQAQISADWGR